jgi:hypothetical protein
MVYIFAAGNTARNIGKLDAEPGGFIGFKNRKIRKFTHNNLLSFHPGLFKDAVKGTLFQIALVVRNGHPTLLGRMFKLDMRAVLLKEKPAVIT